MARKIQINDEESIEVRQYMVKIYEADKEKYSTEITTEDIHDSIYDIIRKAIWAVYPEDRMSEPNAVTIRKAYDGAEFDETGFTAYFGDGCMITATRQ